jgi:hypothetical protein
MGGAFACDNGSPLGETIFHTAWHLTKSNGAPGLGVRIGWSEQAVSAAQPTHVIAFRIVLCDRVPLGETASVRFREPSSIDHKRAVDTNWARAKTQIRVRRWDLAGEETLARSAQVHGRGPRRFRHA